MPKITKVDKTACKTVGELAHQRLEVLAAELGMTVSYAGGHYNPPAGELDVKFSFKLTEIGGVDREQAEFERLCPQYGLKPEHYKAKITNRGTTYELIGFNLTRPKFAILAQEVSSGREVSFPVAILKRIDLEAYYHCEPWQRPGAEIMTIGKGDVQEVDPELLAAKKALV